MKLYLHNARKGQTFKIKNLQFVDGICEHPVLPHYLEKFYSVKDYPPEDFVQKPELSINNEQLEERDTNEEELNKLVKQKKEELKVEKLKSQKDFKQFGSFKSYVKEITGKNPRNKAQANSFMKEHAKAHSLVFEE